MKYPTFTARFSALSILRFLRLTWIVPVCIGMVYFLLQMTQLGQYGVSWDEPLHRNWGKLFMFFWEKGDRLTLELMPGHGIEYGPIFYVANYLFSEWAYGQGYLTFVEANHILTLLMASVVVGLLYILGRMIGGWKIGLGSVVFLVFFPQFLAHSQYNPKDIPLMAAILLTSILFLRAIRTGKTPAFILAGFCMGIAIALKISALIMAPIFLVTYLFWLRFDDRSASVRTVRTQVGLLAASVFAAVSSAYLFWPSAWGDPLVIFRAVQFFLGHDFWPGQVLYFGKQYGAAALPWHYIPFEFFAATPSLTLLAFLVGMGTVLYRLRKKEHIVETGFLLLWILLPISITLIPGIVRYDGIRQFFFIVPPICVLAAIGLRQLIRLLKHRSKRSFDVSIFLAFVFLSLFGEVYALHPYEGSYRNEIVRIMYPEHMDQVFQVEYWGATYLEGMTWLRQHADPDPIICVPTAGVLVTWYPWRPDFTFECSANTDYVMFFTRYTQAKAYEDLKDPVFSVLRMNAALLNIYKIK